MKYPRPLLRMLPLLAVASVVVSAAIVYAWGAQRPLVFNETLEPGNLYYILVPLDRVQGFQSIYVSGSPSCTDPWPTMHWVMGGYVELLFEARAATSEAYLCYGTMVYDEPMLLESVCEGNLTATVSSGNRTLQQGDVGVWTYVSGTTTYETIDLGTYSHVYGDYYRIYVYTYAPTTVTIANDNGETIDSASIGQYQYVEVTLSPGPTDTRRLRVIVSGTAYVRRTGYSITYAPYTTASNETTCAGATLWEASLTLTPAQGNVNATAESGTVTLTYQPPAVNGTVAGSPSVTLLLSSRGGGGAGTQGSVYFASGESSGTLKLKLSAAGYDASYTLSYTVRGANATSPGVTIGEEQAVEQGGGGGASGSGGSAGSGGNNTTTAAPVVNVRLSVDYSLLAREYDRLLGLGLAAAAATVSLLALTRGVEWLVPGGLVTGLAGYLLLEAGETWLSEVVVLTMVLLGVVAVIYHLARRSRIW